MDDIRTGFLCYLILSLLLLLPAVATLIFQVYFVFSLVTSTTDAGWRVSDPEEPIDPIDERFEAPRTFLRLSALNLVPYTLFNLVAFIGVGVSWKCLAGGPDYLQPRALKMGRLALLNMFSGSLSILYSGIAVNGATFKIATYLVLIIILAHTAVSARIVLSIRFITPAHAGDFSFLSLSYLLFLLSVIQLGVSAVISGSAGCDCEWDKYTAALKFFHQLAAAASLGGCMLGIYVSLTPFFSNNAFAEFKAQRQGVRSLQGALLCNAFVFVIGVPVTALVNRAIFVKNDQDLSDSRVFAAAFEQTFMSLCLLSVVALLEGVLLWLLRGTGATSPAVGSAVVNLSTMNLNS